MNKKLVFASGAIHLILLVSIRIRSSAPTKRQFTTEQILNFYSELFKFKASRSGGYLRRQRLRLNQAEK